MLMSYEIIETGAGKKRYWSPKEKLRIVEESLQPGETISHVARRNGVAPNLLYRWRKLMCEGGAVAIEKDEAVVPASEAKRLEQRVRDLERLLGKKTLENEILRDALDKTGQKKPTSPFASFMKGGIR